MAERKSQNKYYPPDWDPSKGPLNRFIRHKSIRSHKHKAPSKLPALGASVRFELPFDMWCLGCHNHIGMGVRYNAKKNQIGMYHSTPVYQFRFKCHLCENWFDIHTDPQNAQYLLVAGGRKKVTEYDPKDIGLIDLADDKEKNRLEKDVFYRLEHQLEDEKKAKELQPNLQEMYKYNDRDWSDPFSANQKLRKIFREQKKMDKESDLVRQRLQLEIPVLPQSVEDGIEAKTIQYSKKTTMAPKQRLLKLVASSRKGDPFAIKSVPK